MVRIAFALLLLFAIVPSARADVLIQDCPFGPEIPAGVTYASNGIGGGGILAVHGPTPPEGVQVFSVDTSHITSSHIALQGQINFDQAKSATGSAVLVLDAEYPNGNHSSSKVSYNPVHNSLQWIDFRLPVHIDKIPPRHLKLSVILTGADEAMLVGSVGLWDVTPADANAWWNPRTGGWIGGLAGASFVILGATVAIFLSRTKFLRVASALSRLAILVGILLVITGIVTLCLQQPVAVYVPLLLNGILATILFGCLLLLARRQGRQIEFRKIEVMDV